MTCGLIPDQKSLAEFIVKMVNDIVDIDTKQKDSLIEQALFVEDCSYTYISKQLENKPKKVFGKKEDKRKGNAKTISPIRNIKIC